MKLKRFLNMLKSFFTNKEMRFSYLAKLGVYNHMSDEDYLMRKFQLTFNRKLDLQNPQTFNEKLQWLKLYDRKPIYTTMVDKYEAKKYVASIIGDEHIIPTLGVWEHFDEIDFDSLPNQFVLKCTHDCGGLIICKDKSKLDIAAAKKKIEKCMKRNYYWSGREWPYKNVKPRIIAEKYMEDKNKIELWDYKFFCFNGLAKCYKVDFDRFVSQKANYFTAEGKLMQLGEDICFPDFKKAIPIHANLEKIKEFAAKLSEIKPFIRTDFYDIDGKVLFGELTFYPASGFEKFIYEENNESWLKFPESSGGGYIIIYNDLLCVLTCKNSGLTDYKFFCFDGYVDCVMVCLERSSGDTKFYFFDKDWNLKRLNIQGKNAPEGFTISKPKCMDTMFDIAATLSKGLPFARVDLYQSDGHIYFGEMTFFPDSGFDANLLPETDEYFGDFIDLRSVGNEKSWFSDQP